MVKIGADTTGEVLEESISDILGTVIDKGTVDPNASYSLKDWSDTAITTTLTTLVLNTLTGGLAGKINNTEINNTDNNSSLNDIQQNNQIAENNNQQIPIVQNTQLNDNQNLSNFTQLEQETKTNTQKYQYEKSNNIKIDNLRQDANRYFNNSEQAHNYINMLEQIVQDKDVDIRFDNTLVDENGNMVNGKYKDGVITINPNSPRTGEFIAIHELTHAIGTKDMIDIVNNYRKSNAEFDTAVQDLLKSYNQAEITEEALADVSAQLFGNQEFINNLSQTNPSIFKKIYNEIKYLWHQFRGYKNQNQFIEDLQYKWEQAYRSNNELNNTTNYSIAGRKSLENIKNNTELYNEGIRSYNQAVKLSNQNIDNDTIRQNTGWFQDKNGDWKYEFSDKDMSIKTNINLESSKTYKLGDILNHDTLFTVYPELADYEVKIIDKLGANGAFNKSNKIINIDSKIIKDSMLTEGTLIHEIQHAIQDIEGFEGGTTSKVSKMAYYNSLGEIEASDVKQRFINEKYKNESQDNILPESSKENPQHKGKNNYLKNRKIVDKIKDSMYNYFRNIGGKSDEISQEINSQYSKQDNMLVDGRKRLNEKDSNQSSFSIQKDNPDIRYSKQNENWQEYLDNNFKAEGTRTNLQDINLPTKKNIQKNNSQQTPNIPLSENVKQKNITEQERYNNYKKNIIKGKEKQVNNLISYKNDSIRNIENKITEKQKLLESKSNKDTKVANTIKSQIENLKSQKNKIENLYNEKIDKVNSKISREKIELETRNMMKQSAREVIGAEIKPLTQDLTKYKDKKAGILFNRETAQRNIDDIVSDKELATSIKETIFNPIQKHQAQKTRDINNYYEKINELNLDKRKKYIYTPKGENKAIKIDEATLAQLLIEKKITNTDLVKYGLNKNGIDKIHKTANLFTNILDELYNKMNNEQVKFGYSPIGKIENYFPHFFENKPDTLLGKVASYFGIDVTNKALPTEIAGITDTFKPGK